MAFEGELTTAALCWRIARRDGVAIGLTSHDGDLTIDGLMYRASPGMTPSAVKRSDGLDADTMDVAGALTSGAISETDLVAGRWDGANVTLTAVDWTDPAARVSIGAGTIGAVDVKDQGFSAELAGVAASLARPVVEETSAECRAELGDRRCRVAMALRRRFARVVSVDDRTVSLDSDEPSPNAYGSGLLRWFEGANGGLDGAIHDSADRTVTLRQPPAFAVAPGTLVELIEGCDKSLAACAGRFGNTANFRGEPYLPGIDLLTRYPGA